MGPYGSKYKKTFMMTHNIKLTANGSTWVIEGDVQQQVKQPPPLSHTHATFWLKSIQN